MLSCRPDQTRPNGQDDKDDQYYQDDQDDQEVEQNQEGDKNQPPEFVIDRLVS